MQKLNVYVHLHGISNLNPTHGVQALSKEKKTSNITKKILVHTVDIN
jgi:hypothetical protein